MSVVCKFNDNNVIKYVMDGDKHNIYRNDDIIYSVCGTCKSIKSQDKKGNLVPTTGKILRVLPKSNRVVVEGVNIVHKHSKPSMQNQAGGIIEQEAPIDASNVMLLHNGQPTRVGFKMDGDKKVRFAKKTGEVID